MRRFVFLIVAGIFFLLPHTLCAQQGAIWVVSWVASAHGPYPVGNPSAQPDQRFAFPSAQTGANDQISPDEFALGIVEEVPVNIGLLRCGPAQQYPRGRSWAGLAACRRKARRARCHALRHVLSRPVAIRPARLDSHIAIP
jgi:hypothetical protein